jgi:hypothetical protein
MQFFYRAAVALALIGSAICNEGLSPDNITRKMVLESSLSFDALVEVLTAASGRLASFDWQPLKRPLNTLRPFSKSISL